MWTWKNCLVFALLFWIPFITASSHGQAGGLDKKIEARLQFEVALQALAGGDRNMAAAAFRGLAASAADGAPERQVYEALVDRAEGRVATSEAAVMGILAETSLDDFSHPWVCDELVRWGAEIRLAEMKDRAAADLEAVLARHYEARGGLERLRSLDDLVATGRMLTADHEIPFRLCRKRPRFYRLDLATAGGSRITACDGQAAWQFDPTNDSGKTEFLFGAQRENLLSQSWFDDVLVRYLSTGESVFLAAIENLDGTDAYRIEVENLDGSRLSIFLYTENLMEAKRLIWTDPMDPPVEITYEYGDVDGLQMPVRQTITTPTETVKFLFDDYKLQQPIDPRFFDVASVKTVGE